MPAHKGHLGNEQADELARRGASGELAVVPDQPDLPWPQVKTEPTHAFYRGGMTDGQLERTADRPNYGCRELTAR